MRKMNSFYSVFRHFMLSSSCYFMYSFLVEILLCNELLNYHFNYCSFDFYRTSFKCVSPIKKQTFYSLKTRELSNRMDLTSSVNFATMQINRHLTTFMLLFGTIGNIINACVLSEQTF